MVRPQAVDLAPVGIDRRGKQLSHGSSIPRSAPAVDLKPLPLPGWVGWLQILPDLVLFESAQLVGRRFGSTSEARLIRHLVATGWRRLSVTAEDLVRVADLLGTYADANIGFADGTIVAMAERLGATRLFTLDRRDFSVRRPRHVEAFELLP